MHQRRLQRRTSIGTSDPDVLALVGLFAKTDRRNELIRVPRPVDLVRRVAGVIGAEMGEELANSPLAVVAPGLQNDADPRPPPLIAMARIDSKDLDSASGSHSEALEDLDRGRLARAVRPEQAQHLAVSRLECHVVEDVRRSVSHPQAIDALRNRYPRPLACPGCSSRCAARCPGDRRW
jgi:hypothetical protein